MILQNRKKKICRLSHDIEYRLKLQKVQRKKIYIFFGAQVDLITGFSESQEVDEYGSTVITADTLDRLHMHGKRAFDKSNHLNLLADAKKLKRAATIAPERVAAAKIADERRI